MPLRPLGSFVFGFYLFFVFGCSGDPTPPVQSNCTDDTDCTSSEECVESLCVGVQTDADIDDGDSDTDSDNSGECPSDQNLCSEECVDLRFDPDNCGDCGITCPYNTCQAGQCLTACDADAEPFGGGLGTEEHPFVLCSANHLQNVNEQLAAHFLLLSDIDLEDTSFEPLASEESPFIGHLDGNGFTIQKLTVHRPEEEHVALFRFVGEEGVIKNLTLTDVDIEGLQVVAGLVAENAGRIEDVSISGRLLAHEDTAGLLAGVNAGSVFGSATTGELTGYTAAGGLIGRHEDDAIVSNSHTWVELSGRYEVGGLIGFSRGIVSFSSAHGSVAGTSRDIGGLIGSAEAGSITDSHSSADIAGAGNGNGGLIGRSRASVATSFATGDINAPTGTYVGGFIGRQVFSGEVIDSYASGAVYGSRHVGGFIGDTGSDIPVTNSYATGPVTGDEDVGGFIGLAWNSTTSNCYSTGAVTGNTHVGGLIGRSFSAEITNSYWLEVSSGQSQSAGGSGLSTSQFQNQDTYVGWDFENVWKMSTTENRPILRWELEEDD